MFVENISVLQLQMKWFTSNVLDLCIFYLIVANRLRDITVYVGKSRKHMQVCGKYQGPAAANERVYINCSRSLFGKYVKIVKWSSNGRSSLSLGEVFVCGTKGESYVLLFCCVFVSLMDSSFLFDTTNSDWSTVQSKGHRL